MATNPGRESMPTPLQTLEGPGPTDLSPDQWKGLALRLDRIVGRPTGFLGADDPGSDRGLVQDVARLSRVIGRMPGTNGIDDEGDGIARLAWEHRQASRRNATTTKGALVSAAAALLVAAAHWATAETAKAAPPPPPPAYVAPAPASSPAR